MKSPITLLLLVPFLLCFAQDSNGLTVLLGKVEPYDLRLEHLTKPQGIDELKPRFSWKLRSIENGQVQSAYHIIVSQASKGNAAPVWDSGKVQGTSQFVEYAGKPLEPKTDYTWSVTVFDKAGKVQTEKSSFSTGIWATDADPNPWKGKWIGLDQFSLEEPDDAQTNMTLNGAVWIWTSADGIDKGALGKTCFRKTFELTEQKIAKAEMVATADNNLIAYLNGKEVARAMNFKTAQIFDLSDALKPGKNVLIVEVDNHGDAPNPAGLIGMLRVEYADSTVAEYKTNETWEGTPGAMVNATDWKPAVKIADLGGGPWGEISVDVPRKSPPARTFAKKFTVKETPVSAKAYIAGLGYYELSMNAGKVSDHDDILVVGKVGDHVLDPVLTDYDKRVPYVTYDIDPKRFFSRADPFVIIQLGNGRYYAPRLTEPTATRTFGYPKVLFQLELKYKDGSTETIVSDESWCLTTDGPIRDNCDYDGEIFDARKRLGMSPDASPAHIVEAPRGKLVAQMMPPMRVIEKFEPISVTETKPGVWVFDFGVNLVGNCTLQGVWKIPPEGTRFVLRHAETLQDDGMLYVANLRGAKCRDIYISSGKEAQIDYTPTFTYHGFRYAELTGLPDGIKPDKSTLTARAINTDLPKIGTFETSNETINSIFKIVQRGTQGNYLSIPTDCPQRDERQGWQGDRAGESLGEMMFFDGVTLYSKWLIDIEDSQREDGNLSDVCPNFWPLYGSNVTWPSAFTIVPESIYTLYGDRRPIERHYEGMKRWLIGHLGQFVKDGIIDKDNYGDWCVPPEKPELIHSQDPARRTSKEVLATAYYIHNLDLLTKYAKMLGKNADAEDFTKKATAMRKAFNDKFLDRETGKYDNGTQTSCVLPLYFNIVPDDMKEKVFATLVNNIENVTNKHIGTGLIGGQWLNRVLSDFGRADLSYAFTTNTGYPSWGYMVSMGATTVWELWNGDTADPAMNSGNHVMLVGDLVIWYYEYLAGIKADPKKPGFEHIIMKPHPVGDLKFVKASINTMRGPVRSDWTRDGNKFRWNIEIPVGSTATVTVPGGETKTIPSGKYFFESTL